MLRRHGKYTKIQKNNPLAVGQCDVSGFLGRRIDLVPDMQYIGNNLVDTEFLVIRRFLDKPNPQMLPPIVTLDPIPVYKPRPETT